VDVVALGWQGLVGLLVRGMLLLAAALRVRGADSMAVHRGDPPPSAADRQ
jgi:hypothetical protein